MAESVVAGEEEEEDRISTLPDDLLWYMLSFLPSRQVVWTSVLARRWRNLWKSVPAVRINEEEIDAWFVNSLLLLCDRAPLHEFEIISYLDDTYTPQHMELWLRYAASCHVQVLRVDVDLGESEYLRLPDMTLICQQLTRLDLCGVELGEHTLDFSSCPVLEVLVMYYCEIKAGKILCQSLRQLVMDNCLFVWDIRTCISCPNLTDLVLNDNVGLIPFLESMPSLVTASIGFDGEWDDREDCYDHCCNGGYYGGCDDGSCFACHFISTESDGCVILEGLCGATNLELTSAPEMFICRRDFKWCHMFSKLKTLLLNEWCLAADFCGLVYFLRYSPILEKLTLHLSCYEQINESYKPTKQLLVSKNLKVVQIKCQNGDERIHLIIKILISLGVSAQHINNQQRLVSV